MVQQKDKEDWKEKLSDMIERETFLATGEYSTQHHSEDCIINDILTFVEKEKQKSYEEGLKWMYESLRKDNDELKDLGHVKEDFLK